MCLQEGCKKYPAYNYKNEKKGLYCCEHPLEGMINIMGRICLQEGCVKHSSHNYETQTKPIYCREHSLDGMHNVKHKKCIQEGCMKNPSHNYETKKKPIYCKEHSLDGMCDVKHKKCTQEGCNKYPSLNYKNKKNPIYCKTHALPEMVNVTYIHCVYEGCVARSAYNYKNEKKGLYCGAHKLPEMVQSKRCMYEDCDIYPSYNYKNIKSALYCSKHSLHGMVLVSHKMCKSDWCDTIVNKRNEIKYGGYCAYCYKHLFPDKSPYRNYKIKELSVVDFIKESVPSVEWVCDKIIKCGCSKRRPDMMLDIGHQVLIIEIDENQHADYDSTCEHKRMMELSQDLGHRPVIFIRFNPDAYTHPNGTKITSCWSTNKTGHCVIKQSKIKEWNERLNKLLDTVKYWLDNKETKMVTVSSLYY